MKKCQFCDKEFKNVKQHEKHCKQNPDYDKYDHSYLKENGANTFRLLNKIKSEKHKENNPINTYVIKCQKCGNEFSLQLTEKQYISGKHRKFCSRSCANGHIHSAETNKKISESLQKIKVCAYCGNEYKPTTLRKSSKFCSETCKCNSKKERYNNLSAETREKLSIAGRHSAIIQGEKRRSNIETDFCKMCESYFTNVEHNIPMFNGWDADIIIHDKKIAILWNGIWHYEKITEKHSLKQVQTRDAIKIKEIEQCGYIPYIIKDVGNRHHEKEFLEEQFKILLQYIEQL